MEKRKCKLCFKNFANGKALGGHMKAHFTSFPLPPKPSPPPPSSSSDSASFSSSGEEDQELEEKSLIYELRENPKKSFKFSDHVSPSNPDSGGSTSIVQDGESETESQNQTRRRSKRNHRMKPTLTNPPAEPEPASSVSYTSPDEDVAIWLMMLSRDKWSGKKEEPKEEAMKGFDFEELNESMKLKKGKGKNRCKKCTKEFRSYRALWSHKKICLRDKEEIRMNGRIFECPFCFKVFGSGQALGGHKRSHLVGGGGSSSSNAVKSGGISLIDLNLPAPMEEDEDYSVVSDL